MFALSAAGLLGTAGTLLVRMGRTAGELRAELAAVQQQLAAQITAHKELDERVTESNKDCERERGTMGAQLHAQTGRLDRLVDLITRPS